MNNLITALVLVTVLPSTALAEPVSGADASSMLFPADAAQVQVISGGPLTEEEAKLVAMVVADQPYYGAIAISPDEELLQSKATIAVANFHTTEAASAEALRQCDALREGRTPCVIAAVIRPRGWQAWTLSLSAEATAGFVGKYPAQGGALAVSSTTAAWAVASGNGAAAAAIKACGKNDCSVVVAD